MSRELADQSGASKMDSSTGRGGPIGPSGDSAQKLTETGIET